MHSTNYTVSNVKVSWPTFATDSRIEYGHRVKCEFDFYDDEGEDEDPDFRVIEWFAGGEKQETHNSRYMIAEEGTFSQKLLFYNTETHIHNIRTCIYIHTYIHALTHLCVYGLRDT